MDKRLQRISDYVEQGMKIADIGTDHGYLPIELIQSGKIDYAIVSDISKESLKKAQALIRQKKLSFKVDARVGAGLTILEKREVDAVIIAGMGGHLIAQILEDGKEVIRQSDFRFILQPMQNPEALRKYLILSGYDISNEALAKEGSKIYQIIVAQKGQAKSYDSIELQYGKKESYNESEKVLYHQLILAKQKEVEKIIKQLEKADTQGGQWIISEYRHYLELLKSKL